MKEAEIRTITCPNQVTVISLQEAEATIRLVSYLKRLQTPTDYEAALFDYRDRAVSSLGQSYAWSIDCGYVGDAYVVVNPENGQRTVVCPRCRKEVPSVQLHDGE